MQGLAIILAEPRDERVWTAFSLAATTAAIGRTVAIFLSGQAAEIAAKTYTSGGDGKRSAYCVATIAELFETCLEFGVRFTVCQTGLHLCEIPADDVHVAVECGGLMGFLQHHKTDELLMI